MTAADFLTVGEVAELLRTSPGALRTQRYRGEAPGSLGVPVGRRLLWRRADVEAWFDAQQNAAPAAATARTKS